jgi:hypothetical protein
MSASEASNDDISKDVRGHMPMPDFEALAWDIQNRASCCVGAATMETRHFCDFFGTSVLVAKINMGVAQEGLLPPREWPPKTSALGPPFYEGVSQAEPGVFGHWRICWRRQPDDPLQVGLGIYQRYCKSSQRSGEFNLQCDNGANCGHFGGPKYQSLALPCTSTEKFLMLYYCEGSQDYADVVFHINRVLCVRISYVDISMYLT